MSSAAKLAFALACACALHPFAHAQGTETTASKSPSTSNVAWRAAFGPAQEANGAPALAWIRREALAQQPGWPKGRDAEAAFCATSAGGNLVVTDAIALPAGCAAVGEFALDGTTIGFELSLDGSETWRIHGTTLPATLARWFEPLRIELDGPARAIDCNALSGNLAGAAADEDVDARLLQLAAMQCGEVTIAARRDGSTILLHGRSAGGLIGPAFVIERAMRRDASQPLDGQTRSWAARAFAGMDGDRLEAVRQLQRSGENALPALRALLHGDEASRLCAIDGLVRMQAASELPRIVAAADNDMPLATSMAATAAIELWPLAAEPTRQRAREALARNPALDASLLTWREAKERDGRWRLLAIACVSLACLLGLWMRERARLRFA